MSCVTKLLGNAPGGGKIPFFLRTGPENYRGGDYLNRVHRICPGTQLPPSPQSRAATESTKVPRRACRAHSDSYPPPDSPSTSFRPPTSGPFAPLVYNLQSPSGQKILRAHIKDLKPYQMPEPPADFANIGRMPNQRIPPPPNGLLSVRQQLDRRLAGQADLMQAPRRAALKIRDRFRRAPRNPQEGRTETRTTRDVRTGKPPRSRKTSKPSSDTDLPPTLPTQANCQPAAPPVPISKENRKHPRRLSGPLGPLLFPLRDNGADVLLIVLIAYYLNS
ncbi:hypothetical protein GEV33_001593 [Tenebrio molitor]|uniref:Uncharacterized protein n=1 Tax=Tenebrio molitor TaxID=7067 RepID=A0A8J6LJF3_TENMO|nr:hypothetical protein GEV33_001593 [Tenebrio molitor]